MSFATVERCVVVKMAAFYIAAFVAVFFAFISFYPGGVLSGARRAALPDHTTEEDAKDERAWRFFAKCAAAGFTPAQCQFFRYGSSAK